MNECGHNDFSRNVEEDFWAISRYWEVLCSRWHWFSAPLILLCILACCSKLHHSRVHFNMKAKCIYFSEKNESLSIFKRYQTMQTTSWPATKPALILGSIFLFAVSKYWVHPTDFYVSGVTIKNFFMYAGPGCLPGSAFSVSAFLWIFS